jgi:hypothetical protein
MRIALCLVENMPLSTYPAFLNSILLLQEAGYEVDAYFSQRMLIDVPLHAVNIYQVSSIKELCVLYWKNFRTISYQDIFFYHGISFVLGGFICFLLKIPYVHFALEIQAYDRLRWYDLKGRLQKLIKTFIIRKSKFVVIQDSSRKALLIRVYAVLAHKILIVPNSYLKTAYRRSKMIHQRLGIPNDKIVVLYPGALESGFLDLKLLDAVLSWAEQFVLVFHGFSRDKFDEVLRKKANQINALGEKRVYFSTELLTTEYLDFISSADIGLVWYKKDISENVRTIGKSSGKFSAFMATNVPVIVPSYLKLMPDIVKQYGCGFVVSNEYEIKNVLYHAWQQRDSMACNIEKCFNQELDFRAYFTDVLLAMRNESH